MDWKDAPYFLAIAETRSLAGAARRLGVNHSTVFRRLQDLEDRTGVQLFNRSADGYLLTNAGEQILPLVQEAEQAVLAVERTVAGGDFRLAGQLRITSAPDLAATYLAPCVAAFQRAHPGIRADITVSSREYDLARGEADIALRVTAAPPDYLASRHVLSLPWVAAASRRYLRQHPKPEKSADLSQHRLVGGDEDLRRLPAFAWLHRNFPPEQFTCTAADLTTVAALAGAGLGVALLPADHVTAELAELFAVQPACSSELWILAHPDLQRVARIGAFSDFLFRFLREEPRLQRFAR